MPDRYDLPEGLHGLVRRNTVRLDHETFRSDVATLLDAVEWILPNHAQKSAEPEVETDADVVDRTIDKEHSDHASEANNLVLQLAKQGEVTGARAAFQRVIDSGHPEAAPSAAFHLGKLLERQGNVAGARAAYQQAIDSGHPEAAPSATFHLEWLLERQGDTTGERSFIYRLLGRL